MATSERTLRLLDINVMIALSLANHVHHKAATSWFEDIDAWATCSITESAYCRLLLNPRVTGFELGVSEVFDALRTFRSASGHEFIEDSASLTSPAIDVSGIVGYRQITDFHLVALAAHHGAVLSTLDTRIRLALADDDRHFVEVIPVD
jgi:mycobacterium tuberculosis PIN domain family